MSQRGVSRARRVGLVALTGTVAACIGVMIGLGLTAAAAVLAVAASVPLMLQARAGSPLYLLGAALPIYAVGPVGPTPFRAGRVLLLGCVFASDMMSRRLGGYRLPNWKWWFYSACLGLAAIAHASVGGAYVGLSLVLVALIGSRIGSDPEFRARLFIGYRVGAFCSALVVLASTAGVSGLSHATQAEGWGGLSYRSTAFSYTAALAIVFWYTTRSSRRGRSPRPVLWAAEGLVLGAALAASGGRGGLVAVLAALVVLPMVAGHLAVTLRLVAAGCLALVAVSALGLPLLGLNRLIPTAHDYRISVADQYGSGRLDLYKSNLRRARENLVIGSGFEAAGLRGAGVTGQAVDAGNLPNVGGQTAPHILLLALVVAGGIGLGAAGLIVLADAGLRAYRVAVRKAHALSWASTGVVVFLVNGLLEIGGGLIGLESALVFSCMVAALSPRPVRTPATDLPRLPPNGDLRAAAASVT